MKIGVCSSNSGPYTTRGMLIALADAAEHVGIESIWVSEHLVLADPREPPSPMDPEDPILDPVTSLAFLAGRTEAVRLGTGIIVLPLRNPLILAKELATVDVLSDGRLIVGIGVGYVEREFRALGVPFRDRGLRTEDHLAAIRAVWSEGHPSYAGELFSFDGIQARPRPLQGPHPPIVMGGYAPAVLRRAVRGAQGWYGWGLEPESVDGYLTALADAGAREPRREDLGPLEITVTPPGDVDVDGAARYAEIGVDRLNLMLPWKAESDDLANFFTDVIRPLVDANLG
jgi:probable F420-dependent oxidoreductase